MIPTAGSEAGKQWLLADLVGLAVIALAFALLGVFVKDIALLLFVTPALLSWFTLPEQRRWRSLEPGGRDRQHWPARR